MKSSLCLAALIFFALPALSQDHAPTVQQCSADSRLWLSQSTEYSKAETERMKNDTKDNSVVMKLTLAQLNTRVMEMLNCAVVDPASADDFDRIGARLSEARDERYRFYVERHGLVSLMILEDMAGKRN